MAALSALLKMEYASPPISAAVIVTAETLAVFPLANPWRTHNRFGRDGTWQ